MPEARAYLGDGRLELDNNICERSIRPVAPGRKNCLFPGSVGGGEAAAIAYALIETAEMNNVDPEAWLTWVLERIADHRLTPSTNSCRGTGSPKTSKTRPDRTDTIEQLFRTTRTKGFDVENVSMETAPFKTPCAMTLVAGISCMQLVQGRDGAGKRSLQDVFEAEDQPILEAVSTSLERKTEKQKNPHSKGSLAFAAWGCARLGGWTGYYGKPGPVVMLRGLYRFRSIQLGYGIVGNA